ncbi:unnamed protein product [Wuchereria bancrofti]|uniref:Uncharacterized protein n=2 Tax=Wuchereria bancrofti TaxID=6293 RepID=A0A3P7DSI7_WUCBA|nr:unnamed protein product [Wuchereria bancrofti]
MHALKIADLAEAVQNFVSAGDPLLKIADLAEAIQNFVSASDPVLATVISGDDNLVWQHFE